MSEGSRKGADRRLTFTQTPYTDEYSTELSEQTGISRAELYNTAMRILAVQVGALRRGTEYVIRNQRSGRTYHDPALPVLLGDILTSLERQEE